MGNDAMNDIKPVPPQSQMEEIIRLMQAAQHRLDEDDLLLAKSLISTAIKIATQ